MPDTNNIPGGGFLYGPQNWWDTNSPLTFPSPPPTTIPNVGQYNTPGSLPTDPGPILTGDYPSNNFTPDPIHSDIWTRMDPNMGYIDPSITINPGETNYPTPGTGAEPPPQPSIGRRVVNNIPLVRLANLLGKAFAPRGTNWENNAASRTGPMQGPPAVPPGGALFGFNPSQGGGTPRFDFTRGTYTSTPSLNPLYTTGGPWQSVANAPADIRFAQNSGTGNFTADQTSKYWTAAGGYRGTPNRQVAPDSGRDKFTPGTGFFGQINADTGLLGRVNSPATTPFNMSQSGGPPLRAGDPASAAAYNAWLAQQPGYHWTQNNTPSATLEPFGWMNPTISGPPPIPRGMFGVG